MIPYDFNNWHVAPLTPLLSASYLFTPVVFKGAWGVQVPWLDKYYSVHVLFLFLRNWFHLNSVCGKSRTRPSNNSSCASSNHPGRSWPTLHCEEYLIILEMQSGSATAEMVRHSSAEIVGWASARLSEERTEVGPNYGVYRGQKYSKKKVSFLVSYCN